MNFFKNTIDQFKIHDLRVLTPVNTRNRSVNNRQEEVGEFCIFNSPLEQL